MKYSLYTHIEEGQTVRNNVFKLQLEQLFNNILDGFGGITVAVADNNSSNFYIQFCGDSSQQIDQEINDISSFFTSYFEWSETTSGQTRYASKVVVPYYKDDNFVIINARPRTATMESVPRIIFAFKPNDDTAVLVMSNSTYRSGVAVIKEKNSQVKVNAIRSTENPYGILSRLFASSVGEESTEGSSPFTSGFPRLEYNSSSASRPIALYLGTEKGGGVSIDGFSTWENGGGSAQCVSYKRGDSVLITQVYYPINGFMTKIDNLYFMAYGCAITPKVGNTFTVNNKKYIMLGYDVQDVRSSGSAPSNVRGYGFYAWRITS